MQRLLKEQFQFVGVVFARLVFWLWSNVHGALFRCILGWDKTCHGMQSGSFEQFGLFGCFF